MSSMEIELNGAPHAVGENQSVQGLIASLDLANKSLAVVRKATNEVFTGPQVRDLVGLPAMSVRVKPDFNPEYDIYVQSTSVNRKLLAGTQVLLIGV